MKKLLFSLVLMISFAANATEPTITVALQGERPEWLPEQCLAPAKALLESTQAQWRTYHASLSPLFPSENLQDSAGILAGIRQEILAIANEEVRREYRTLLRRKEEIERSAPLSTPADAYDIDIMPDDEDLERGEDEDILDYASRFFARAARNPSPSCQAAHQVENVYDRVLAQLRERFDGEEPYQKILCPENSTSNLREVQMNGHDAHVAVCESENHELAPLAVAVLYIQKQSMHLVGGGEYCDAATEIEGISFEVEVQPSTLINAPVQFGLIMNIDLNEEPSEWQTIVKFNRNIFYHDMNDVIFNHDDLYGGDGVAVVRIPFNGAMNWNLLTEKFVRKGFYFATEEQLSDECRYSILRNTNNFYTRD